MATSPPPFDGTSGRRTRLARWLTRTDSPASALLARVMVNRIWKQLFGQGIVPTPDNFGIQGQPPTHPELLEWLSAEFVANGWRIKPLIKLMMTSTAYRQASRRDTSAATSRPDSRNGRSGQRAALADAAAAAGSRGRARCDPDRQRRSESDGGRPVR